MSNSPEDLDKTNGQRSKQSKMNSSEHNRHGENDEMSISLNELRQLIRNDILEASDKTNSRIDEMSVQIKQSITKLETEIDDIKVSQQFISNEFEALKISVSDQKEDIISLKREVSVVKTDCVTTHQNVEELNYELNVLKQSSLESHMLISNVIKAAEENIEQLLHDMFTLLGIVCNVESVLSMGRLSSSNQQGIQPILVRFACVSTKEKVLKAARDRPIFCDEIGLGVKQRIYFNHRLTPANQRLLGATRRYKKQNNFKFAWFSNGEIFLRKDESSRAIKITDIRDLSGLH